MDACDCPRRIDRLRETRRSLVEILIDPAFQLGEPERVWGLVAEITTEINERRRLHRTCSTDD